MWPGPLPSQMPSCAPVVGALKDFQSGYEDYKALLVDGDDIEECLAYMHEAETRFISVKERLTLLFPSVLANPSPTR